MMSARTFRRGLLVDAVHTLLCGWIRRESEPKLLFLWHVVRRRRRRRRSGWAAGLQHEHRGWVGLIALMAWMPRPASSCCCTSILRTKRAAPGRPNAHHVRPAGSHRGRSRETHPAEVHDRGEDVREAGADHVVGGRGGGCDEAHCGSHDSRGSSLLSYWSWWCILRLTRFRNGVR